MPSGVADVGAEDNDGVIEALALPVDKRSRGRPQKRITSTVFKVGNQVVRHTEIEDTEEVSEDVNRCPIFLTGRNIRICYRLTK